MRKQKILVATTTLVVLLAAIYLHLYLRPGKPPNKIYSSQVQNNDTSTKYHLNNNFSYNNGKRPNILLYVMFLAELRIRLTGETNADGIAVTRPAASILLRDRFLEVLLENGRGDIVTVLIDTTNVYVVGYLLGPTTRPTLYYLDHTPEELFRRYPVPDYNRERLGFDGNYNHLADRETTKIGHGALNVAIKNLHDGVFRKRALCVIIQMLSEAVRIRYIELVIRLSMVGNNPTDFIPDLRARSMEDEWSKLSRQVQCSDNSRIFLTPIAVRNASGNVVSITSVGDLLRRAALALILYSSKPKLAIRMPVPVVAVGDDDEQCPNVEPTTNIIGRDGQCMDVIYNQYNDGDPIILYACGNAKRNQLWTFKSDGTIRSNGKCLTTYGFASGSYIMIYDCDTAVPEATKWILYNDGTIMNPKSGLVIAAETDTQGGIVMVMAEDNNSSRQAWSAGNYTQPDITYIAGFDEMCLQANSANTHVRLANCVIGTEPRQQWALYGDNTIRTYRDQTVCLMSDGHKSLDIILLKDCEGTDIQRWTFMADGTILNPDTRLVMDVKNSDVTSNIILFRPTGNLNQKWLAF